MEIKNIKISEIKAYPKNTKKHPKSQVEKIKKSITEFGFNVPLILNKDNEIIVGHGRLLAAKDIGMKKVPCIYKEGLTPSQIKAYRIADNRTAESEWDFDLLKEEFTDLSFDNFDLELTGFDSKELDSILKSGKQAEDGNKSAEVNQIGSLVINCPKCGHKFKKKLQQ